MLGRRSESRKAKLSGSSICLLSSKTWEKRSTTKKILLVLPVDLANIVREYYLCDTEMSYEEGDAKFAQHFDLPRKLALASEEERGKITQSLKRGQVLLMFINRTKTTLQDLKLMETFAPELLPLVNGKERKEGKEEKEGKEKFKDVLEKVHKYFWRKNTHIRGLAKTMIDESHHYQIDVGFNLLAQQLIKQKIIATKVIPFIEKFTVERLDELADDLSTVKIFSPSWQTLKNNGRYFSHWCRI